MENSKEDILTSEEQCLSKEELVGHSNGSLGGLEHERVKAHLKECELCASAAKGFSIAPSLAMLSVLDNDLKELVDLKFPSTRTFNLQQILNVAFAAVIITGAVYFFSNKDEVPVEVKSKVTGVIVGEEAGTSKPAEDGGQPVLEPPADAAPQNIVSAQKKEVINEPVAKERGEVAVANFMPLRQMDVSTLDAQGSKKKQRVRISINTRYVLDMKTYDYEKLYKREHEETWYNPNLGVPAQYAHSTDVITYSNGPDYKTVWMTYEEILYSALTEYKRGRYDQALTSLNLLLEDFPSDINGLFYKGLCLYNTRKFNKSIRYMTSVLADVNPTFDQEAEWFIALAYLKQGERTTAIERLNKIVAYDAFYKQKAQKELKVLE